MLNNIADQKRGELKRVDSSLENYKRIVIQKQKELKQKNKTIRAERGIADFKLRPGTEITNVVRENLGEILKEFDHYVEGKIPLSQRKKFKEIVNTHRIFIAGDEDHDRARIEFDNKKIDLVNLYQKEFNVEWPKYENNIYCNDNLFAKEGKGVSRHHGVPVRALLVEKNSKLEHDIDFMNVDLSKPLNLAHYKVNEIWNMFPVMDPKNHIDGIHNDNTIYSKVFGKILMDYHYKKTNINDETHYTSILDEKSKLQKLPEFSTDMEFHLKSMEYKLALPIHQKQKKHIYNYVARFVQNYPENNQMKKATYEQILGNLSDFYRNKNAIIDLKNEWEYETNQKWPENAKIEFLLPVYYKLNNYQWWMIHPSNAKEEKYVKGKSENKRKTKEVKNNMTIEQAFENARKKSRSA